MGASFINSRERKEARVGEFHPSRCLEHHYADDQQEELHMVAVCSPEPAVIEIAVPESCFAVLLVSDQIDEANRGHLGITETDKVQDVFWAVQFYPSTFDSLAYKSPANITQCRSAIDGILESDVKLAKVKEAVNLDSYCST